ncbi:MAG: RuBisCO large subunit C-terminal-like domain-containing protein [Candidatus Eremiobacteraeota bacterium]|nr:RuBisCO large subunit C-terminal-like domain-containing protein [Candidatus Eremiobacteraeota bacterium]
MASEERIRATYWLHCPPSDASREAEELCLEQTVEVPGELVKEGWIRDHIVGRIERCRQYQGFFEVEVSFSPDITACTLTGLLNVLYGNISLKKGIYLSALSLPGSFVSSFQGPRFGAHGVRDILGVHGRPLLAAPLKPMGKSPQELGALCYELACGGIDLIKDDHGITDQSFSPFRERVKECIAAVRRAEEATGRRVLYFPCVNSDFEDMERHIRWAVRQGVGGLLISPFITGLAFMKYLAASRFAGVPLMAHPALTGSFFQGPGQGIDQAVLLGTLMRLAGADLVIYPNFCGRFPFTGPQCLSINKALSEPLFGIKEALPVPAGGMSLENIPALRGFYGDEVVFLVGSSLFLRRASLRENASYFLSLVKKEGEGSKELRPPLTKP